MSHDSTYSLIANELEDWPTAQAWVKIKFYNPILWILKRFPSIAQNVEMIAEALCDMDFGDVDFYLQKWVLIFFVNSYHMNHVSLGS